MVLTDNEALIGVDLGGTKVAAGRIDENRLTKIERELIPAHSENSDDILDAITRIIDRMFDDRIAGIGIGIPGLVDRQSGMVNDVQNIPSWKEVPLKTILEERFQVPVYTDNDANCFALGELHFGKGRGTDDFVGLTIGTGMGSGIIKNGMLLSDAHGGSGEFGNISYLSSIYEDYCSGKFFVKNYNLKGEQLLEGARNGDPYALRAFEEFGNHLGNAIKTIMLSVDPQKVIIGGSVAQAHEFFKNSMWKSILKFPFPSALHNFEVIFSEEKNIAVLGAASLYLDKEKQEITVKQE